MSNRQIRKLQQNTEEQEVSEEEQEEALIVKNKFGDFSEESEESEEEIEEVQVATAKPLSNQQEEKKSEENIDELLEGLEDVEPAVERTHKQSSLKRNYVNFDASLELQKLFKEESKRSKKITPKMCLTPDKANWSVSANYLLQMEKVPDPVSSIFFFNTSRNYNKISPEFLEAIESNDPNSLMGFLNRYPLHVEALFQVCMVYQMQGKYEQVGLFLERILFSFQKSFHHQFSPIGSNLLDIDFNDLNKIFHKSLFMQIDILGRKGCPRTALEHTKFLLSLSPDKDPLGCLFLIDYYSLRSRQFSYFLDFVRNFFEEYYGYGHAICLPHLMYSTALCKALITQPGPPSCIDVNSFEELIEQDSSVILVYATRMFPSFGTALLNKLSNASNAEPPSGDCLYGNLDKVSDVYATRNAELWKADHIAKWLRECMNYQEECPEMLDDRFPGFYERYSKLVVQNFSFDVHTAIPEDLNVGRNVPQQQGNLDPNSNPFYLYLASMLPWNEVNFEN